MLSRTWLSLFGFVLVACGGGEPEGEQPAEAQPADGVEGSTAEADGESKSLLDAESEVHLTIAGEGTQLSGGAQLEVREQNPVANLVVTAVYEGTSNLVTFQLAVLGVENVVGVHRTEIGPPGNSAAFAQAYLERQSYSSGSGSLEVTLAGDGSISGSLEVEMFQDSEPGKLDESGASFNLVAAFEGSWKLLCRSPVQALPGDHSVSDSAYCRGLKF